MEKDTIEVNLDGFFAEFEKLVSSRYLDSKDFKLLLKKESILTQWECISDECHRESKVCVLGVGNTHARKIFEQLFIDILNQDNGVFFDIISKVLKDYIRWNSEHSKSKLNFEPLFEEMDDIFEEEIVNMFRDDIEGTVNEYAPNKLVEILSNISLHFKFLWSEITFGVKMPCIFAIILFIALIALIGVITYKLWYDWDVVIGLLKIIILAFT
ncbi:hypothetical protein HNP88_000356 [Methanococcus maripaludis]|uniref:Uncharacterized protein n=1 Tax=Methanococcus maripaludis TaxID=39152 RepID=A0A7J9NLJ2_METMI|nr:hypothetical protein [Methanococcus maripaludis]MBA2846172.1 hypothetical protein [Methanococcus maripaludis]